jgi:hypothetical protein
MNHTWSLIVLLSLIGFASNAQKEVKDKNLDEFGRSFMAAIQSQNIDTMLALKPSPDIWRAALPKETQSFTDEQLVNEINKNEKFINDFNQILQSARESDIDLMELTYMTALYGENEVGKMIGISLKYSYKGQEILFPVSLLRYKEKFYLSEILLSYQLFKRNNLGK